MNEKKKFDIPVSLFIFKRTETLDKIFNAIRIIKPSKIYLIADGPRNEEERVQTASCRIKAEKLIDWECQIIKDYAENNRGVYQNIGEGAKRVFQNEDTAIFLEDDNLPDPSFFFYCEELLEKYKHKDEILWINGTNYLGEYESSYSYMFTQHLLPCGWASWGHKFNKYYDGNLSKIKDNDKMSFLKKRYISKSLFRQQKYLINLEKMKISSGKKPISWDFQMDFSLKYYNLYGISPRCNLINNIGVDIHSIHGGNTFNNVMTKRFCGIRERKIETPLVHPELVRLDISYEKKVGKILLFPWQMRFRIYVVSNIKKIMRKMRLLKE